MDPENKIKINKLIQYEGSCEKVRLMVIFRGVRTVCPCRSVEIERYAFITGLNAFSWSWRCGLKKILCKNIYFPWRKTLLKILKNFFFENFLKFFRPKNIFWGKSENHPKTENRKLDFRFSILGWFSDFPQKIFFGRKNFKKFSKKSFSKFSKSFSPWKINIFS